MREMKVVLNGDIPENYYRAWYRCINCGTVFQHDMKKGRPATEMDGKCPTCNFKSKTGSVGGGVFPIIKYNPDYDKRPRHYFM